MPLALLRPISMCKLVFWIPHNDWGKRALCSPRICCPPAFHCDCVGRLRHTSPVVLLGLLPAQRSPPPLGQKPWQAWASCCPSPASLGKMRLWSGTVPSAADGHRHVVTPAADPCPSQESSGVPGFVWVVTFCPPMCWFCSHWVTPAQNKLCCVLSSWETIFTFIALWRKLNVQADLVSALLRFNSTLSSNLSDSLMSPAAGATLAQSFCSNHGLKKTSNIEL